MIESTLRDVFEKVVREEARKALKVPKPVSWSTLIVDPSSGEFSMSRLGLGVLLAMVVGINLAGIYLMLRGEFKTEWFTPLTILDSAAIASVAGVYGFNSSAGAKARGSITEKVKDLFGLGNTADEAAERGIAAGPGAADPER